MIVRAAEHVLPKRLRDPALHSIICRSIAPGSQIMLHEAIDVIDRTILDRLQEEARL